MSAHLNGQVFAENQVKCLMTLGLGAEDAWRLINIIGPSRAVTCYEWITAIRQSMDEAVLQSRLNRIARKCPRVRTETLLDRIFREKQVLPPTGGYTVMVRHLRVAQYLGLVSRKIKLQAK